MYNPADLYRPTKEDVYKLIPEYDLFAKYLTYKPVVGKIYNSPFRFDYNPSFGIFRSRNGSLLFKDLGNGESGDAIKFAKLIEGFRTTQETVEYLYKEYKNLRVPRTKEIPEIKPGEKEIYVNKIKRTQKGLDYWAQYGITESTLDHFKVHEIDKYYVNGRLSGWTTSGKLMFNFEIYDKDKIYRPYDKKKRFYTNCTSGYIQGWEQLDYTKDTVIITKSMKDVMFLYQEGFTAIAPNGEGHAIPDKALKILKDNFKYIIVFYDWDKAGVCGARRLVKENPCFGFIFTNVKSGKDITDLYLVKGDEAKEDLKRKISHAKQKHFKYC